MATRLPWQLLCWYICVVLSEPFHSRCHMIIHIKVLQFFNEIFTIFPDPPQNKEVAMCYHGYRSYAPLSDIVKHQGLCAIPFSLIICIQIPLAYTALPYPLSRPLFPFCLSTISLSGNSIYLPSLSTKGSDAIQPRLNCFISMIIFLAWLSGFYP